MLKYCGAANSYEAVSTAFTGDTVETNDWYVSLLNEE
jgi:hypothetical protein